MTNISPRLLKGALVGIDMFNPLTSLIVFQYNPDTMTRTLQPQTAGEGADRSEALRLKGAPVETIRLDIEIDAADQLEKADPMAVTMGIYPQLSALEMLIYPKSSLVIANTILLAAGTLEIVPPVAPFTLFIWGPNRVVPVRIADFSITEEAYDVNLNPLRAKVSLGLPLIDRPRILRIPRTPDDEGGDGDRRKPLQKRRRSIESVLAIGKLQGGMISCSRRAVVTTTSSRQATSRPTAGRSPTSEGVFSPRGGVCPSSRRQRSLRETAWT